jgi:hypothetical protein
MHAMLVGPVVVVAPHPPCNVPLPERRYMRQVLWRLLSYVISSLQAGSARPLFTLADLKFHIWSCFTPPAHSPFVLFPLIPFLLHEVCRARLESPLAS